MFIPIHFIAICTQTVYAATAYLPLYCMAVGVGVGGCRTY